MREAPATLHVLIGPVGAGKTTLARTRIAKAGGVLLDVDTWMVRLFGDDPRPVNGVLDWYLERRDRCRALVWDVASDTLDAGSDVWLELGLLTARERRDVFERAQTQDRPFVVHLLDAPREVRRARVLARNDADAPHTQIVPLAVFERASDAWEDPTEAEIAHWNITTSA